VTQPQNSGCMAQIAPVVSLKTTRANGSITAGAERCWTRFDHRGMHDVFIVISESEDGEHIARTVFAASEDDARQTHREHYAGEPIVEVQQETIAASQI
jgi:hypothetical protein